MGQVTGLAFRNTWRRHFSILVIGISACFSLAVGQTTTAALVQTDILSYDCRRVGAYCQNNKTCIETTGRCDCDRDQNYICENLPTLQLAEADYNESVHGACTNSSGHIECVCDEGYYGKTCDVPRVDVECNESNMTVYINPYGIFEGEIFVINGALKVKDACKFEHVSDIAGAGEDKEGMALVIQHISKDCGNTTLNQEYGNLNYTRDFFLEYVKEVREATDQLIRVTCVFTPSNRTVLKGTVTITDTQSEISHIDVHKDTSVKVTFTVTEKGSTNTDAIRLGQDIDLKFSMETTQNSAYNDFIITSCEVTKEGDETISIDILENECPTTTVHSLITKNLTTAGPVRPGTVTESMSMKAFVFLGESNSTLVFVCIVEFCEKSCIHPPKPCNTSNFRATHSKKRRATDNEQRVSAKITVVDPASQIKATSDLSTQDCLQQPSFIAIMSTLGVLVLLLLTLCIVLILRLLEARPKQSPPDSDARREPVYELKIPRISLTSANPNHHLN
ncbi:unnamed protein product [Lymnaea stagnalis]|uniref:ZP domain-containing protein n=1 Tax=Lymnaea stagnalis TaxID=6523 RepID=A0AAV2H6U6_LYMST